MSLKEKIISITLTILFSVFALIPLFEEKIEAKEQPQKLYQVYLDGQSIGIIKSKIALESYINKEQKELKKKYDVNTVYLPQGLYVAEYIGYSENILTEKEIYRKIKDIRPFTIKGYVVTIDKEESIKINVLKKEFFETSVNNTVKAFIPEEAFNAFMNSETEEIKTTGERIEDLYVREDITIKESLIPSDEKIFTDEKELTRYLLFGSLKEPGEYTVKLKDTIESIAFDNKLGIQEFLVINPQFNSSENLLYVGQKVKIGEIKPIISVIEEVHRVEDKEIKFRTEIKYDSTKSYGSIEIAQAGSNGLQRVTQKIQYNNGYIEGTPVITNTEELKPALSRIEVRGTYSVSGPVVVGNEVWGWPTTVPYIITSPYGYRWGGFHDGTDISGCGYGSPIYAANGGNVHKAGYDSLGGNQIIINHNNGYYTIYAHMSKLYVVTGQAVQRGQIIGLMGSTGVSTGTHLHFGVFEGVPYRNGRSFNAMTLYR